ncbi:essential MCU regulator, mitochondrial-like [Acipenser ruthenus]|uniref:essential MCU regulator, mitochondrial-like n=1 Tax=Acipenser ruthenus TaxID=7906 RepID=UPI00145B9A3E|nr:essential MCU regulator, mitochondrial-like [Acipenser ruthenus]
MAFVVCRSAALLSLRAAGLKNGGSTRLKTGTNVFSRSAVTTASGKMLPKPVKTSFGLVRMTAVVLPFLYIGTLISKSFAALLEEHDIFVPEDDDDDD